MKKILFVIFLLLATMSIFANVLEPKGEKKSFNLLVNGPVPIVVPDDYTPTNDNRYVLNLQKFLKQMYDIELPIVKESEYKGTSCISLGNTKMLSHTIYANNQKKLNDDGIGLQLKKDVLYIYGGPWQGMTNAVSCLLEEDLGCRWWRGEGEDWDVNNYYRYIPKYSDKVINFVPRDYNPPFIIRDVHHDKKWYNTIIDGGRIHWLNLDLGQSHTTFDLVSPDNFKAHPEWFSEIDGKRVAHQLCLSNPEVIKMMTDKAREIMKKSGKNVIGISPQDSYPLCDCETCRALDTKEGSKSATLIKCLNEVYEGLKNDIPNLKIQTLAYLDYVKAPKTLKPNKNLMVMVCSDSCDWYVPFGTFDETKIFQNSCKEWAKTGAFVYVWIYCQNFNHYLLPYPNYPQVAKNLKLLRSYGVKGVFTQVGYGLDLDSMNDEEYAKMWVWAHLMWNPNLDYNELREEFFKGYYKTSAEPLLEYEKLLDNLYFDAHKTFKAQKTEKDYIAGSHPLIPVNGIRFAPDADLYTNEFCEKALELTQKAIELSKGDDTNTAKAREIRMYVLYLNLGRALGYTNETGRFVPKDFDKSKIELYKSWWTELNSILDENKIGCIAEIWPKSIMKNDRVMYMNNWKVKLFYDLSEMNVREIKTPWKFITNPENKLNPLSNDFDTSNWIDMPCNTNWETIIGDYDGYAWYKRVENFTKEDLENKNIMMLFGAVDEDATVYVNGKLALEHTGAKLSLTGGAIWDRPFCVNIKPFLQEGENQIKVLVHDEANAGGIWEPVKIILTNQDVNEDDLLVALN